MVGHWYGVSNLAMPRISFTIAHLVSFQAKSGPSCLPEPSSAMLCSAHRGSPPPSTLGHLRSPLFTRPASVHPRVAIHVPRIGSEALPHTFYLRPSRSLTPSSRRRVCDHRQAPSHPCMLRSEPLRPVL